MKPDGGPAFPGPGEIFLDGPQGKYLQSAWGAQGSTGMSLHSWFAGQALAGLRANPHAWEELTRSEMVTKAFDDADAMIAMIKARVEK